MKPMRPRYQIYMPQWTHADMSPGEQAARIAAKSRMTYAHNAAGEARRIASEAGRSEAEVKAAGDSAFAACPVPRSEGGALLIEMYTGDHYEAVDVGDGRWGAKLVKAAGPAGFQVVWNGKTVLTPEVGTVFTAPHGSEHEPLPEISTQNIRVECGVVKVEGRVDGHDEELRDLWKTVKSLEAEVARLRGEVKGLGGKTGIPVRAMTNKEVEEAHLMLEDSAVIRGRNLET